MNDGSAAEPRKRGRPKGKGGVNMDIKNVVKKDDISRIIYESKRFYKQKPPKDNIEFEARIEEYFDYCVVNAILPTVEDLSLSVGMTRQGLHFAENNPHDREKAEIIQRAKAVISAIDAKLVLEGKIPQVAYIFRAKNYYGMKDQQDVTITPNNPLGESVDIEKIKQKYLDNVRDVLDDYPLLEDGTNSQENLIYEE